MHSHSASGPKSVYLRRISTMAQHWYSVMFAKGSSSCSYMIPAACTGNAISIGWCRLEDSQGTRDGWSLIMVSPTTNCGGKECCGCEVCTPDDATKAFEALDIATEDKTTLEYLMFLELELEASGDFQFYECQWDSEVGRECMKVLRKAQELTELLPDIDHSDIWHAAYHQCEVFYCG
jgi:hypothetical protein